MAKRTRTRKEKRARPSRTSAEKTPQQAVPATPSAAAKPAASTNNRTAKGTAFTQDYYYVYNDVRLLLGVTVVMIILMIGLSFVL